MTGIKCISAGAEWPQEIDFVKEAVQGRWYRCVGVRRADGHVSAGDYVLAGCSSDSSTRIAFVPQKGNVFLLTFDYRVVPVELDLERSVLVFHEVK